MPYVYLDDHFDEHPKVVRAGPEAGFLYVAALCWTNRNLTGGRIPKEQIARLAGDGRRGARLAARLVAVVLFEDEGDTFVVHDYDAWNHTALAAAAKRSEKAKKAAEARWNRAAPGNARASGQAAPEQAASIAPSTPPARAGAPNPNSPTPTQVSSSVHPEVDLPEQTTTDDDAALRITAETVAERQLARQRAEGYRIGDVAAWLAKAVDKAEAQLRERLAKRPDLSLDEVAEWLEPTAPPPPRANGRPPDPLEQTGAAQSAQGALNEARMTNPCPDCGGSRFQELDSGDVVPCETCDRTGVAPATTGRTA